MNIKKLLKLEKEIILASRSPRRKKLLEQLGFEFQVIPSKFDEDSVFNEDPSVYVQEIAKGKVQEIAKSVEGNFIIIGSDTTVYFDGKYLNKPQDENEAFEMLSKMSGKEHFVWSGIVLLDTENNRLISEAVSTKVKFREIEVDEIKAYIKSGSPMDKAGSYGIQDDFGSVFVESIEGDFYNVVGLPLEKLYQMFKKLN